MARRYRCAVSAASAFLAVALVLTGCSRGGGGGGGGGGGANTDKGFKIGLLLPEGRATRYESFDLPLIQARISQRCAKCQLLHENADQDPARQQSQAEAMLTQGVKVLILDAVDAKAAVAIVNKAKSQNVPVVAYDRLIGGPIAYYVSFDNRKVGELQGQALADAISRGGDLKRGDIVMINGSPTDPNAADFKAGAHAVLNGKVNIGKEFDAPDWSPDRAQQEMDGAISALGWDRIIGVYAANDGIAGGAIASMKAAGFPAPLPPVTGQDAELAAVQRIVSDDQYMSVYKAIKPEAEAGTDMAIAAATGKAYAGQPTVQRNNGTREVISVLLNPVLLTKANIKDTVIKDGAFTTAQICAGRFAEPCAAAGIS
jgi:D-xylose transport system substrate-binding protein